MTYVVLARKWRPQTFDDLVGQEHVSRTLANAIAAERVAHAFLFTGVRGVGKTTSARILAKTLNCEKGPTATPCLECNACREIGDGMDVDVQEIDGASYTGVDAVRSLQETIPYRPSRDRYKIFIVDEVHMLSTAAWNAFLKTLEEPPPHVKFIFATTEVNKVPVTILSRCQRYDFKLIRSDEIATRLRKVLDAEGVKADDAAVRIIAREAAGSMRDAMSLLDQVIAWVGGSDESLDAEAVARVLGVAARSVLHRLGAALVDGDASSCLDVVGELANQGFQLSNVARDFLEHLRQLVVAKVSEQPHELLELADDELADLKALAERTDTDDLSRIYLGFSRAYDDIARSAQPRGALEMALVRLSRRPPLLPLDELLRRLAALEKRIGGQPPGGGGGAGSTGGGGSREGSRAGSRDAGRGSGSSSAPRATGAHAPAGQAAATHAAAPQVAATQPPATQVAATQPPATQAPATPAPERQPPRTDLAPAPTVRLERPAPSTPPAPVRLASPASVREPGRPAASTPAPPAAPSGKPQDPAELADWQAILTLVRDRKPGVASVYEHGAPLRVCRDEVRIGYEAGSFLAKHASAPEALETLGAAVKSHFGPDTPVELDTAGRHGEVQTVAAKNSADQAARLEAARRRVAEHPLVITAIDVLGAELREVRLPGETG